MKLITSILIQIIILSNSFAQNSELFLQGMAELSNRNYNLAISLFTGSIEKEQYIDKSYLNRGIAYLKSENYVNAEKDFIQVKTDNNEISFLWLAKLHALTNNPALCIRNLKTYLEHNTHDKGVIRSAEFKTVHYSREWQDYVSNLEETKSDEELSQARYLLKTKDYKNGISKLDRAINETNDNALLYFERSKFYRAQGNLTLAILDLKKGTELEPENIVYNEFLADIYYQNGEKEKAIDIYQEILNANPEKFTNYLKLARVSLDSKNNNVAQNSVSKYLDYFPNDTAAIYLSAKVYFAMKEFQKSLLALNTLIEKQNKTPQASWYLLRANCFYNTGTLKYAAEDYSMHLDMVPNSAEGNLKLGNSLLKLGQLDKACFYWRRALRYGELEATHYLQKYCN